MKNIYDWSVNNKLNMIEVSTIIQLFKDYPHETSIQELVTGQTAKQAIKKYMQRLVEKEFVVQNDNKFRLTASVYEELKHVDRIL